MQTAFQSGAFQPSGFQFAAEAAPHWAATPAYGWATERRAERRTARPVLRTRRRRPVREPSIAAEIRALEAHLAEALGVSRETVRLKARTRDRNWLPPYALQAVNRAITEQTRSAHRAAITALRRVERDEEEEFAVLYALLN